MRFDHFPLFFVPLRVDFTRGFVGVRLLYFQKLLEVSCSFLFRFKLLVQLLHLTLNLVHRLAARDFLWSRGGARPQQPVEVGQHDGLDRVDTLLLSHFLVEVVHETPLTL